MTRLWILLGFVLGPLTGPSLSAHEDTIVQLRSGRLLRLPVAYQPATFSFTDRRLAIGKHHVSIPACVWRHFAAAGPTEIKFSASWYHDPATLPPYLVLSGPESR